MDRGYVLAGCWVTALVVGEGVIVWGYRADRRGVPFPWQRYWHWWRVSMALSMIAAVALIPIGWLAYSGRPPGRLSDLVGLLLPFLLFGIGFAHWRLWFPILGVGKPILGTYMPREVYIQQSLRTFGYSLGLGLAGPWSLSSWAGSFPYEQPFSAIEAPSVTRAVRDAPRR